MRTVRFASMLIAAVLLTAACEKTADSPGKGDTANPYGGADAIANGSVGSTPGYLSAAGVDKNPNTGKAAAAAPTPGAPAAAVDSAPKSPEKK